MRKTIMSLVTAAMLFSSSYALADQQVICTQTAQGTVCPVPVVMQPAGQQQGIPATNAQIYIAGITAGSAVLIAGLENGAIGHRWHRHPHRFHHRGW